MRKKVFIATAIVLSFAVGAISNAATNLEVIQANLNHGISFLLNGEAWIPKDANGAKTAPISYKGTTYIPLRAVAEATGAEVTWDSKSQTISINTVKQNESSAPKVRMPFSADTVSHVQKRNDIHANGITRNKEELLFGETQYTAAFAVYDVGNFNRDVTFKVKDGTTRVGVLIGYKVDSDRNESEAMYSISGNGSTFAAGVVKSGTVVETQFELPKGVTELTLTFRDPNGSGAGYLIWDESWVE
jgi:hypothetical protein